MFCTKSRMIGFNIPKQEISKIFGCVEAYGHIKWEFMSVCFDTYRNYQPENNDMFRNLPEYELQLQRFVAGHNERKSLHAGLK